MEKTQDQVINKDEVVRLLEDLKGWALNEKGEIGKEYKFKDFFESMEFVNAVATLAEAQNHHPDILIQYSKVNLSISTHSAGGITQKDFDFAKGVESLPTSWDRG